MITGQKGDDGNGLDITGSDPNEAQYIRAYWLPQILSTDEAVIGWADRTIADFHFQKWTESDQFVRNIYDRIMYQVTVCNEFIRQAKTGYNTPAEIDTYIAEARFLRALSYWHALDLFGNVPFATDEDALGAAFPEQITRADLFSYIEDELLAIEDELKPTKSNDYGRADQSALWTLLTKLYLNANVYNGTDRNTDAAKYADKVIKSSHTLEPNYQHLFLADNHLSNGIIYSVNFDGIHTQNYGGTTFLTHAPVGGKMKAADFGINGGWGGIRTTKAFVEKFDDISGNTDQRAMFFTDGQKLEIEEIGSFGDGYAVTKWKNIDRSGNAGSDSGGNFTDIDFPLFRLADVYLMYAEAVLRGGAGSLGDALNYVNLLRERAYGDATGNITSGELTLDFILDERSRELFWEGHRRTDLIRFGKFSESTYVWPWKGGVKDGKSTSSHLNLLPLPSSDLNANPNLTQNLGYN
ncbi:RagB/SusD family nutrient uptake outer membrane protein [Bacteroidota bacterium]